MMKLCATIMGMDNETRIADAIVGIVDWVDVVLLIDTGLADATLAMAESVSRAKLVVRQFSWCDHVGAARNFALYHAAQLGADWAITVDGHERFSMLGIACRNDLEAALATDESIAVWYVRNADGLSAKARVIRLPVIGQMQWTGDIFESLQGCPTHRSAVLKGIVYKDLDETVEHRADRLSRNLVRLERAVSFDSSDASRWFHLGRTYQDLGRLRESIAAFRRCVELRQGLAEQAAAAAYFAASISVELKDYEQALLFCGLGLARDPRWPELFWLAGFCNYCLDRFADSILWENLAISLGHFRGLGMGEERTIYRYLPAWYEAPYEVMKFAFEKLNQPSDHREAAQLYQLAMEARLHRSSIGL